MLTPVLTHRSGATQPRRIENYERLGGYAGLRKALTMAPEEIIAVAQESNCADAAGPDSQSD